MESTPVHLALPRLLSKRTKKLSMVHFMYLVTLLAQNNTKKNNNDNNEKDNTFILQITRGQLNTDSRVGCSEHYKILHPLKTLQGYTDTHS